MVPQRRLHLSVGASRMGDVDQEDLRGGPTDGPRAAELPSALPIYSGTFALDPVVHFQPRPVLLAAADRVVWRLSLLVLILSKFRSQRARVEHLHLMFWALGTSTTRALMASWWKGLRQPDLATVKSEPRLEVTLSLAVAEALVRILANGKAELTPRGKKFAQTLDSSEDVLVQEKELLASLQPLTETAVWQRMGGSTS